MNAPDDRSVAAAIARRTHDDTRWQQANDALTNICNGGLHGTEEQLTLAGVIAEYTMHEAELRHTRHVHGARPPTVTQSIADYLDLKEATTP